MIEVLELFDGVKNVEFTGFTYCKEVQAELPVFTLKGETAKEWNAKAEKINTKSFIEIHGRQPKDYDEVLKWVYSYPHYEDEKEEKKTISLGTIRLSLVKTYNLT